MGTEATLDTYLELVRQGGSKLDEQDLGWIFEMMSDVPFTVNVLPRCGFLHFGTTRQIIDSGIDLLNLDHGISPRNTCLSINNSVAGDGAVIGMKSWVEGCRIGSRLTLGGDNIVAGLDVDRPLDLPNEACVDVLGGTSRTGKKIWFVRCYGINDRFKEKISEGAMLCNLPMNDWLKAFWTNEDTVWEKEILPRERTLWNARIFPAVTHPLDYRQWLWMCVPAGASAEQKSMWLAADRYSLAEIARLADLKEFYGRREQIHAREIIRSWRQIFSHESGFTARDLAYLFGSIDEAQRVDWIMDILKQCYSMFSNGSHSTGLDRLEFSRIIHTLGTAVSLASVGDETQWKTILSKVTGRLAADCKRWYVSHGFDFDCVQNIVDWIAGAHDAAFNNLGSTIILNKEKLSRYPKNAMRSDEIIWGRAPARFDLGGGWTDTPPYALEHGGRVINAAVDLNGQPPIHVYARVIDEQVIRITSIDHGVRVTITKLDELLDYRKATSEFGIAKAALVLSGFSPEMAHWPEDIHTLREMLNLFGGGIELTTLAAIPSGSGLGTSSIMGAVLISVVNRLIGRSITQRELFNSVLQLEQELTTGGGWQDQIGGTCEGVKIITADAGLIPDPRIHHVLPALLDPGMNNGQTLLYYTGIRRLAKNILRTVVGNYLDRDRAAMATLKKLYALPPLVADAMALKDMKRFGELIDVAWRLNKEIDPDSTTEVIEEILAKIKPYIYGAKLLGAGGGGFLLMVCKSTEDASVLRTLLEHEPPNNRARFFDYNISTEGLVVTTC
jgi:galactokinase/mevalonate kinase-like predicted kinase